MRKAEALINTVRGAHYMRTSPLSPLKRYILGFLEGVLCAKKDESVTVRVKFCFALANIIFF